MDPESELVPDAGIGIYNTPIWNKLTVKEREKLRHEAITWQQQALVRTVLVPGPRGELERDRPEAAIIMVGTNDMDASKAFYKAYFTTPGFRAYWAERRASFVPAFQEVVDQWLTEEPPIKKPHQLSGDGLSQ